MLRILATALLALCLTASAAFATSLIELVMIRHGPEGQFWRWHEMFSDVPFTGEVDEGLALGAMKNGKQEGPWTFHYPNGKLKEKGTYKDGSWHGPYISFWDNGQIEMIGSYKNGWLEGRWVAYDRDGRKDIVFSGNYRDYNKVYD